MDDLLIAHANDPVIAAEILHQLHEMGFTEADFVGKWQMEAKDRRFDIAVPVLGRAERGCAADVMRTAGGQVDETIHLPRRLGSVESRPPQAARRRPPPLFS
jgi:hypothetical protein